MTELPGKRYGALNAWPDPDARDGERRWLYLPHAPQPQRAPDGRPQVTLIEAGPMTVLTLGVVLIADDAAVADARSAIHREIGGSEPVRLIPASVTATGATLVLLPEGDGPPRDLAKAIPSPTPPYSAAFSAMLKGDDATAARDAIRQGRGKVAVRYAITLDQLRTATARVTGDPGLAPDLDTAIQNGHVRLDLVADADASDTLLRDTRNAIFAEAERLFATFRSVPFARPDHDGVVDTNPFDDPGNPFGCKPEPADDRDPDARVAETRTRQIDAEIRRVERVPLTLTIEANLSDWM